MCQNWRTANSSKHQVDKDSYAEYLMWMQDRIALSVLWLGYRFGQCGIQFPVGTRVFVFSKTFGQALGHTLPLIRWVVGSFSGSCSQVMKLPSYLHLVSLTMSGAVPLRRLKCLHDVERDNLAFTSTDCHAHHYPINYSTRNSDGDDLNVNKSSSFSQTSSQLVLIITNEGCANKENFIFGWLLRITLLIFY